MLVTMAFLVLMSGCATTLSYNTPPGKALEVAASNITVINYNDDSRRGDVAATDDVNYESLPSSFTNPTISKIFVDNLENRLKPKSGSNQPLEITLLSGRMYSQARGSDRVPFVGMINLALTRDLMCRFEVNYNWNGKSTRKTIDVNNPKLHHWVDKSPEEKQQIIENCIDSGMNIAYSQINEIISTSIPSTDNNSNLSVFSQIEKLKQLKENGAITDGEFQAKKKELLNRI